MGADAPDSIDGAPTLATGTTAGCYGEGDKRDMFMVAPAGRPGAVLYRIAIQSDAHVCVNALDATQAKIHGAEMCGEGPGATFSGWVSVAGDQPWYLETFDLSGDALSTSRAYTLSVEPTPIEDAGEPDTADAPIALTLGTPAQAYFASVAGVGDAERDYFVVEVPKNMKKKTSFAISVTGVPDTVQLAVKAWDAKKGQIGEKSAPNPGAELDVELKMKGPGTYTFELRNIAGSGTAVAGKGEPPAHVTAPYTITISVP